MIGLRPLRVDDADAMTAVLAGPGLYAFTGGSPPSREELMRRYRRQVVGRSPDGHEEWANHVILLGPSQRLIGYLQATIPLGTGAAEVAWVVGEPWQGRGYATAAMHRFLPLLAARGVRRIHAHIHPDHEASRRVAVRLGMRESGVVHDGEVRWTMALSPGS